MKIAITRIPDIEDIFVKEFRRYYAADIKLADIYKNLQNLRVSPIHPFAYLIDQQVNGTKLPVDLFPCLAVIANQDSKAAQFGAVPDEVTVAEKELQDIVTNKELYVISEKDVDVIDQAIKKGTVWAKGISTVRTVSMSFEIWADNVVLKNRIYDLAEAFLVGLKRYELYNKYEIRVIEESISGNRGGNYNFDFGKVFYGGMIQCSVDYGLSQYFVDTDLEPYHVIHTYEEINHGENEE